MINLEDYECDGCRADTTFGGFHCGVCPRNGERLREYNRKYGNSTSDLNYGYKSVIDISHYVSD